MTRCIYVCFGIFPIRKYTYCRFLHCACYLFNSCIILCIYRIGNSSWATSGVTTDDIRTVGNLTTVQCSSAHLTSFAVLVDVTGGLSVSSICNIMYTKIRILTTLLFTTHFTFSQVTVNQ